MPRLKCIVVSLFLLMGIASAQPLAQQLRDVKKIYVGSFGEGESSNLIRAKVISALVKSHQIDVMEDAAPADATLLGAGQVTKEDSFAAVTGADGKVNASGGTIDRATAGVRLVAKDQRILWVDDVSNSVWSSNATSSIADRICKDLLKAMAEDAKRVDGKKHRP